MSRSVNLDRGWSFRRLGDDTSAGSWTDIDLPHSPFVSDLNGRNHWFGECDYRRVLESPLLASKERAFLYVGAAMQTATVFVNEVEVSRHEGGFLPFEVDLTEVLSKDEPCEIRLRLDNRESVHIPPGKAYNEIDFCWYGGLYRSVELRIRPSLHITEAISADVIAGGGVFFRTLSASESSARVTVDTHVFNSDSKERTFLVQIEFQFATLVATASLSEPITLQPGKSQQLSTEFNISRPQLWSPSAPHIYEVVIRLLSREGEVVDERRERVGLRRIAFSRRGGFVLNGQRLRLRGTNRHQEMPAVGYAVPRAAQFRDALRIKNAGFDYVRLSHYPQSPDFLDACDQLGIVVMNCIPGWQFLGGEQFVEACEYNTRQLIRRDRNHACVVLWELSLNETPMDEPFMAKLYAIGHEEYPGDQMFTCGWIDRFDVFTHSRQHGQIHTWRNGDKAMVIAEYGDWEYYASNAGFNQTTGTGLFDPSSNSRRFRGEGERALRQQTFNHMVALNDTLSSPAVLDGQWAVFDYARGYATLRAAVGIMDVYRLPKYSYYFYRSQRDADEIIAGATVGAIVFLATQWTPTSDLSVVVYSNCDEVELRLNGSTVLRRPQGKTAFTQNLPHPPYFFELPHFSPGTLEAIGYNAGEPCANHSVSTPEPACCLELVIDDLEVSPAINETDVLLVHARLLDARGTVCNGENESITFSAEGAVLLGQNSVETEAGIASIVVKLPPGSSGFTLSAAALTNARLPAATLLWERKATHRSTEAIAPNSDRSVEPATSRFVL